MNSYDVTLAELAEQQTAVIRGHVPHDGIGAFIGESLGRLMTTLGEVGGQPAGPPFARYQAEQDGSWDIEIGCSVRSPVPPVGGMEPSTLPACRAARVLHRGAYDQLVGAYRAGERWIQENGMRQSGATWELYLDDPSVAEPRTEVFLPCTEAHR